MSAATYVLIASCFFTFANAALQCYSCNGQLEACLSRPPMTCPDGTEFCKIEYAAATKNTIQVCAGQRDCETARINKRQAPADSTAGDQDVNPTCCSYDNCNCAGPQCVTVASGSRLSYGVAPIIAVVLAILFS